MDPVGYIQKVRPTRGSYRPGVMVTWTLKSGSHYNTLIEYRDNRLCCGSCTNNFWCSHVLGFIKLGFDADYFTFRFEIGTMVIPMFPNNLPGLQATVTFESFDPEDEGPTVRKVYWNDPVIRHEDNAVLCLLTEGEGIQAIRSCIKDRMNEYWVTHLPACMQKTHAFREKNLLIQHLNGGDTPVRLAELWCLYQKQSCIECYETIMAMSEDVPGTDYTHSFDTEVDIGM